MSASSSDSGVLTALAQRLIDQRLPRALALKEKVDQGAVLQDRDVEFLERVLEDANKIAPVIDRNPKYKDVAGRMLQLYKEIMAKALENEQAKKR